MNQLKLQSCAILAVALLVLLGLASPALAEKPDDPGGGPKDPGGSSDYAVLYGDLYVLERDGNGEPVTTSVTYDDPESQDQITVQCLQPIAEDCTKLQLWGQIPDFDPEVYDPCEIYTLEPELPQEVSFGRQSVVRTDEVVIDSAYFEALKVINSATTYTDPDPDPDPDLSVDVPVRLDPASRFELYIPVVEDATECIALTDCDWKTIDSPLGNLSLYRALMLDGCLMPITVTRGFTDDFIALSLDAEEYLTAAGLVNLICLGVDGPVPDEHPEALDMLMAAAFWGGAADKTSEVSLDEFINANTYLGINSYIRVGGSNKKPELEFTYFNFTPFSYDRDATHPGGGDDPGEGLPPIPSTATLLSLGPSETEPTFVIADGQVLFGELPPSVDLEAVNIGVCRDQTPMGPCLGAAEEGECGPANYFAQAAEDSRKIIWFLHNWSIPEIAY